MKLFFLIESFFNLSLFFLVSVFVLLERERTPTSMDGVGGRRKEILRRLHAQPKAQLGAPSYHSEIMTRAEIKIMTETPRRP